MAVHGFGISTVSKENKEKKRKQRLEESEIPSAASLINAKPLWASECVFCNEKHDSSQCDKAKIMSLEERQQLTKTKNTCFNCLKIGQFQEMPLQGKMSLVRKTTCVVDVSQYNRES